MQSKMSVQSPMVNKTSNSKKLNQSMTPDINSVQTYAERSCLGGINSIMVGSNTINNNNNSMLGGKQNELILAGSAAGSVINQYP